jgi:hypothetical protein
MHIDELILNEFHFVTSPDIFMKRVFLRLNYHIHIK